MFYSYIMLVPDRILLSLFPLSVLFGFIIAVLTYTYPSIWGKIFDLFGARGLSSLWKGLVVFLLLATVAYLFLPKDVTGGVLAFLGLWFLSYILLVLYKSSLWQVPRSLDTLVTFRGSKLVGS